MWRIPDIHTKAALPRHCFILRTNSLRLQRFSFWLFSLNSRSWRGRRELVKNTQETDEIETQGQAAHGGIYLPGKGNKKFQWSSLVSFPILSTGFRASIRFKRQKSDLYCLNQSGFILHRSHKSFIPPEPVWFLLPLCNSRKCSFSFLFHE